MEPGPLSLSRGPAPWGPADHLTCLRGPVLYQHCPQGPRGPCPQCGSEVSRCRLRGQWSCRVSQPLSAALSGLRPGRPLTLHGDSQAGLRVWVHVCAPRARRWPGLHLPSPPLPLHAPLPFTRCLLGTSLWHHLSIHSVSCGSPGLPRGSAELGGGLREWDGRRLSPPTPKPGPPLPGRQPLPCPGGSCPASCPRPCSLWAGG